MKPGYYVMIGLALLLVGFAIGRFATPKKIVEKESKEQAELIAKLRKQVTDLTSQVSKDTTIDYSPVSGKPVKKTVAVRQNVQKHVDLGVQEQALRTVVETKTVEITKDAPRHRLGLTGDVNASTGRIYGGIQYQYRIAGPLILSVNPKISPPRNPAEKTDVGIGVGVSLEF